MRADPNPARLRHTLIQSLDMSWYAVAMRRRSCRHFRHRPLRQGGRAVVGSIGGATAPDSEVVQCLLSNQI